MRLSSHFSHEEIMAIKKDLPKEKEPKAKKRHSNPFRDGRIKVKK